jgi:hypothetical protein
MAGNYRGLGENQGRVRRGVPGWSRVRLGHVGELAAGRGHPREARYVSPLAFAQIDAALGDREAAFPLAG